MFDSGKAIRSGKFKQVFYNPSLNYHKSAPIGWCNQYSDGLLEDISLVEIIDDQRIKKHYWFRL